MSVAISAVLVYVWLLPAVTPVPEPLTTVKVALLGLTLRFVTGIVCVPLIKFPEVAVNDHPGFVPLLSVTVIVPRLPVPVPGDDATVTEVNVAFEEAVIPRAPVPVVNVLQLAESVKVFEPVGSFALTFHQNCVDAASAVCVVNTPWVPEV